MSCFSFCFYLLITESRHAGLSALRLGRVHTAETRVQEDAPSLPTTSKSESLLSQSSSHVWVGLCPVETSRHRTCSDTTADIADSLGAYPAFQHVRMSFLIFLGCYFCFQDAHPQSRQPEYSNMPPERRRVRAQQACGYCRQRKV